MHENNGRRGQCAISVIYNGDRAKMRKISTPSDKKDREIKANTPVETANVLGET
jgi:hypothetical protein